MAFLSSQRLEVTSTESLATSGRLPVVRVVLAPSASRGSFLVLGGLRFQVKCAPSWRAEGVGALVARSRLPLESDVAGEPPPFGEAAREEVDKCDRLSDQ